MHELWQKTQEPVTSLSRSCILGKSAKKLKKDTAFHAVRRIRRNGVTN